MSGMKGRASGGRAAMTAGQKSSGQRKMARINSLLGGERRGTLDPLEKLAKKKKKALLFNDDVFNFNDDPGGGNESGPGPGSGPAAGFGRGKGW